MIAYLLAAVLVLVGGAGLLAVALVHARDANTELRTENARLRDQIGRLRRRGGT